MYLAEEIQQCADSCCWLPSLVWHKHDGAGKVGNTREGAGCAACRIHNEYFWVVYPTSTSSVCKCGRSRPYHQLIAAQFHCFS